MGFLAGWTIVQSSGHEGEQTADNLGEGSPDRSCLMVDRNAAIKTPNRDHAGFASHPAYHSIAEKVIFSHTLLTDGYTDWL